VVALGALTPACGGTDRAEPPRARVLGADALVPVEGGRSVATAASSTASASAGNPATAPGPASTAVTLAATSTPSTVSPTTTAAPAAPTPTVTALLPAATTPVTQAPVETDPLAVTRAEVLARISYPWRTRLADWSIEFLPGRSGYLGYTWIQAKRIEIYVRDGHTVDELAFTLAHELGHAVDLTYLDDAERATWLQARGNTDVPWWPGGSFGDFSAGCGDWAEAFAVWQLGGESLTQVAGQPDAEQLRLLARLATS